MSKNIESHLVEDRVFKPAKEFSRKARISSMAQYRRLYKESIEKPAVFATVMAASPKSPSATSAVRYSRSFFSTVRSPAPRERAHAR